MKTLVLYYSLEGSTALIAETIAKASEAALEKIQPKAELSLMRSNKFFAYSWVGLQMIRGKKIQLKELNTLVDTYDFIFIGTPVWGGKMTPVLESYLSSSTIENKNIALFCVDTGNPGETLKEMKGILEENNKIIDFMTFTNIEKDYDTQYKKAMEWAEKCTKTMV